MDLQPAGPRAEAGAQPGVGGARGRRWDLGVFGAARVDAGGVSAHSYSPAPSGRFWAFWGHSPGESENFPCPCTLLEVGAGAALSQVPPSRAGTEGRGPGGGEPRRSLRGTAGETGGSPAQGPPQLPPFSPGCSLGVKCSACGGVVGWPGLLAFPPSSLELRGPRQSGHLDLPPAEHVLLCCL